MGQGHFLSLLKLDCTSYIMYQASDNTKPTFMSRGNLVNVTPNVSTPTKGPS